VLAKSLFSFKVLTECPIIVVLLFQSYRCSASDNIMKFIPLLFQVLDHQNERVNPVYLIGHFDIDIEFTSQASNGGR
jgi:hypothetical protein